MEMLNRRISNKRISKEKLLTSVRAELSGEDPLSYNSQGLDKQTR